MVKSAREGRTLSSDELRKLRKAYDDLNDGAANGASQNTEAQKLLKQVLQETALSAELADLKQAGKLTPAIEEQIQSLGSYEDKLKRVDEELKKVANNDSTVNLDIQYHGENIMLQWKSDMEIVNNLPDINKIVEISDKREIDVELTTEQLKALNNLDVHPKHFVVVDEAGNVIDDTQSKLNKFNQTQPETKYLEVENWGSSVIHGFLNDLWSIPSSKTAAIVSNDGINKPKGKNKVLKNEVMNKEKTRG